MHPNTQSAILKRKSQPWTCGQCGMQMKLGGRHIHLRRCGQDPDALLWPKIDKNHPSGCWVYSGACDRRGYGRPAYRGTHKRYYAHRRVYELLVGPIPDGMLVLHKCDNPPCCNPAHLFLGTDTTNSLDKWKKRRGTPKQLSAEKVREIRADLEADKEYGRHQRIGKKHGVQPTVVCQIALGQKYWYYD